MPFMLCKLCLFEEKGEVIIPHSTCVLVDGVDWCLGFGLLVVKRLTEALVKISENLIQQTTEL
jgi:hypothetical protein